MQRLPPSGRTAAARASGAPRSSARNSRHSRVHSAAGGCWSAGRLPWPRLPSPSRSFCSFRGRRRLRVIRCPSKATASMCEPASQWTTATDHPLRATTTTSLPGMASPTRGPAPQPGPHARARGHRRLLPPGPVRPGVCERAPAGLRQRAEEPAVWRGQDVRGSLARHGSRRHGGRLGLGRRDGSAGCKPGRGLLSRACGSRPRGCVLARHALERDVNRDV